MRLQSVTLDRLRIEDERSYRHIGLYEGLKQALLRDKVLFRIPAKSSNLSRWDRVLFLNLTYWSPDEPGDVLDSDAIPADVVMHAAWHHVARNALVAAGTDPSKTPEGFFLGESIASAFDIYLIGRLLGHSPDASFLETQVPAMAEIAEQAGVDEAGFEALLDAVAQDPDQAFKDLRELLFDASTTLVRCKSVDEAAEKLEAFDAHRFGPILHHYELTAWILYARAYAADLVTPDEKALAIDRELRRAPVPLDWLEKNFLPGSSASSISEGGSSTAKGRRSKR